MNKSLHNKSIPFYRWLLCFVVCAEMTISVSDAFACPLYDNVATITETPTNESQSEQSNEEPKKNGDDYPIVYALQSEFGRARYQAYHVPKFHYEYPLLSSPLLRLDLTKNDPSLPNDWEPTRGYFYELTSPVESTNAILIDGAPVQLENGMDLSGKDLSGVRINNVTLSRVNFEGANLSGANLEQARFYGCNFRSADFTGANAELAFFPECDFSNARLANSRSFWITWDQYRSTKDIASREITFDAHRFTGINYTDFFFTNDAKVNAIRCNFYNAYFFGKCSILNMSKEQLSSTQNHKIKEFPGSLSLIAVERDVSTSLSGLDLSNCRIDCLSFEGYDLSGVDFTDARITNCLRFINCVGLTPEQLQSTWNWKNGKFNFDLGNLNVDWSNVDFSGLTFNQTSCLGKGSVAGANFTDAKINYSTWANSRDVTVEQIKSTWNYKNREMCFMLGNAADLDWSGNDFSNFTFAASNLDGSNITDANFSDATFLGQYWAGTEIELDKSVYTDIDYTSNNIPDYSGRLRTYSLRNCKGLTRKQIESTRNFRNHRVDGPDLSISGIEVTDEIYYHYVEF